MTSSTKHVAIIGAGVIGLTIAQETRSRGYTVHILARDFFSPSSSSQDWASPWAGFNWCSFATMDDTMTQHRDEKTFRKWSQMVRDRVLPREEMELMPFVDVRSEEQLECWFRDLVPDFKIFPGTKTSPPTVTYKSIAVSTPAYLSYLMCGLTNDSGVHFHTITTLPSLGSIFTHEALRDIPPTSLLVVNATGLGSLYLSDVKDTNVYPIRGQTILVNSPSFKQNPKCVMSTLTPKPTYVIPRAASGLVVLGGTFDEGDWGREAVDGDTERILRDCLALCPQLLAHIEKEEERTVDKLDVVSVNVGTRPARKGETRVELDAVRDGGNELRPVLHAYGAGKAGFQSSIGIAEEALDLVDAHFRSLA